MLKFFLVDQEQWSVRIVHGWYVVSCDPCGLDHSTTDRS